MHDKLATSTHWSFWFITAITLIWNAMGCINFIVQLNPEVIANYRDSERAIIESRPMWATIGFALGVFAGALGCLALLLRKTAANFLFIVSLVGVVVTMTHSLGLGISYSLGDILGVLLMPLVVAAFLVWYAKLATGKNWIR